jgi:hypothetical protein
MSDCHSALRPTRRGWPVALVLGAMLALGASVPAVAQTKPAVTRLAMEHPLSALYVGSSFFYYNNGLPGHVSQLLAAADPQYKIRTTLVAISGSALNWHDVESYFRPGAIGTYSFDAANRIVFNKPGRLFDIAILSDCSQCPIHPQLRAAFFEYAKKHSATIRKHDATPVLFMTWAYADEPQMTAQLAEAYTLAGNENKALVIPAGLAFARSVKLRPELNLYIADKRHPSMAGTYLAALTVYASLFHKSPVGLAYRASLDADTARFLQTVAWDTVQEYFSD